MSEIMNAANTTELLLAKQKIHHLETKMAELKPVADAWGFAVTGEVFVKDGSVFLKFAFRKGNGEGFNIELNREKLNFFAASPESLVTDIAEEVYQRFYKEQIRNRITGLVAKGIQNASLMETKL